MGYGIFYARHENQTGERLGVVPFLRMAEKPQKIKNEGGGHFRMILNE